MKQISLLVKDLLGFFLENLVIN